MIEPEKRDFMAAMMTVADLYDKKIKPERVAIYWEALKHRSLDDVRLAINRHVQDAERGRWFPLPADVSAQLPREAALWLDADEAWARCPKDEYSSAAMCGEMQEALSVSSDLIADGDMVAARMAFKGAYNRLVEVAKTYGSRPVWYASRGFDKEGRHVAEVEVVKLNNLALPPGERKPLPISHGVDGNMSQLMLESKGKISDEGKAAMDNLMKSLRC